MDQQLTDERGIDIATVSELTGLPASRLRYYEERGLIRSIGRRGLRRVFDDQVIERLALITLGQAAGFSLDELVEVIEGGADGFSRPHLRQRADDIDATIERLTRIRDVLRHTADCPVQPHMDCPNFRELLDAAMHHPEQSPIPIPAR